MCVHGHAHAGAFMDKIGKVPVINAGALLKGLYSKLLIVKHEGKWKLKSAAREYIL